MDVTLGGIAGLIAAIGLLILVGMAAVPLWKLGKVLDEVRSSVREVSDGAVPILVELKDTVVATNSELAKVGTVTDDVSKVTGHASTVADNAAQLSNLFAATLGGPLVKISAFSYGVRRAIAQARKS